MSLREVKVPDIGDVQSVDVIEVCVKPGDQVAQEDSLIVLETDKATVEVPAPFAGLVKEIKVNVGDKVGQGHLILVLDSAEEGVAAKSNSDAPKESDIAPPNAEKQGSPAKTIEAQPAKTIEAKPTKTIEAQPAITNVISMGLNSTDSGLSISGNPKANTSSAVHAGPAIRRLANELGVDLAKVSGSGPKSRVLKEDVHRFVKDQLNKPRPAQGSGLPVLPDIDFSQWGEVELVELSKIQKLSAHNLHRSWVNVPHVTQFDEADITELEAFRKEQGASLKEQGVKLTPLAFMVKAVAHCLRQFPRFNSSLHSDGQTLVLKRYCNVGIAVDTPNGLVVPVVKSADTKSVVTIAQELQVLSAKARDRKLSPADMQGGSMSISSLGGIGGTAFTPIVNWPEVAILGVSRSTMKPVYQQGEFTPRLMLPLSLSYDHRVIDGADAARFTTYLAEVLSDIRKLLL